jgi:hypothetical protein
LEVFLDLLPNQPKNDKTREEFRKMLRDRLEKVLDESVERIWDLPPLIVNEPIGDYVPMLLEARELYVEGSFYSCVAMCGIVGERLAKDLLRVSVLIKKEGAAQTPTPKAFDQFERVEVSSLVKFLKEASLLSADAAKAASDLGELRNSYAHARGKPSKDDAIKAITLLHVLVENTVSVFKDFEIKDGAFVPKGTPVSAEKKG